MDNTLRTAGAAEAGRRPAARAWLWAACAVAGITLYHQGSADLIDDEVRHRDVDVMLCGIAGRQFTPGYLERILPRLEPRVIVATHHDDFFVPLGHDQGFALGVDVARFPGARLEGGMGKGTSFASATEFSQTTKAAGQKKSRRGATLVGPSTIALASHVSVIRSRYQKPASLR